MNIRPNQAAILCCLGLLGASSLPIDSSAVDSGNIFSAIVKPLRLLQREAVAQETSEITPSHVYQATSDLISEIEILRDAMGVTVYPVEAEAQEDRAPPGRHVLRAQRHGHGEGPVQGAGRYARDHAGLRRVSREDPILR